ncbi:MAG TPA: hypothetical protein PK142_01260 [bacterium]|nr:hypothetical protein [bacterium]
MDKNRKIALIILSVFSVTIIVIWGFNFKNNLQNPFSYQGELLSNNTNDSKTNCENGNCSVGEMTSDNLELKEVDTDGDRISDWDELFVYGTSPYLEDTDGDTLNDYEEIFVYKTNVNCPEGKDCSNSSGQSEDQNSVSSENSNDFYDFLTSLETSVEQDANSTSSNVLSGDKTGALDAQSLRQILIQSGMEESDLQQINDDDLMILYQEVLADL